MRSVADLNVFDSSDLASIIKPRSGETKLGHALGLLPSEQFTHGISSLRKALDDQVSRGVRFVILGIAEDIGSRANLSRAGSHEGWGAFLDAFLNIQANQFIASDQILLLGEVALDDLRKQALNLDNTKAHDVVKLRELCSQIDRRVALITQQVLASGLELIVIGGGHNNSYPIQQGLAAAQHALGKNIGVACINCDAHSDFRALEGRHSGNGFTYAYSDGLLKAYFVLGLHEGYTSNELFASISAAGFQYLTYEDIKIRAKFSWLESIQKGIDYISAQHQGLPLGIELDLDAIAYLPVSAETPNGISSEEAAQYVYRLASEFREVAYLHIPEGAPRIHANYQTGCRIVGRVISNAVAAYIKARSENNPPPARNPANSSVV